MVAKGCISRHPGHSAPRRHPRNPRRGATPELLTPLPSFCCTSYFLRMCLSISSVMLQARPCTNAGCTPLARRHRQMHLASRQLPMRHVPAHLACLRSSAGVMAVAWPCRPPTQCHSTLAPGHAPPSPRSCLAAHRPLARPVLGATPPLSALSLAPWQCAPDGVRTRPNAPAR